MQKKLCPKCGAYWQCDCVIDYADLAVALDPSCEHDWVEAVGIEADPALGVDTSRIVLCRLCGLYSVSAAPSDV